MTPRIIVASFAGTAIEFYDFHVYALAAALVLGPTFFPTQSRSAQLLAAFAAFAIAYLARPIGSAIFGHFGDRMGRKTTLVASLLIMGLCTTLLGLLPGYAQIGYWAPLLLCILRFGQGIGLGGEWGGAALLALENAPASRRAWFAMFPQLGSPIGYLAAIAVFHFVVAHLDNDQFRAWGWRIPFLLSAALVAVGLYARLKLSETPVFKEAMARQRPARVPLRELFSRHGKRTLLATFAMVAVYTLINLSTVFAIGYSATALKVSRQAFLSRECLALVAMAVAIPISAALSDRVGRRPVLLVGFALTALSGFFFAPGLNSGSAFVVTVFLCVQLFLVGVTFAPMGAFLPELFPTRVRYTGASVAYNLAGILGASFAPYVAQTLAMRGGLGWVGAYLTAVALISFTAVLLLGETAGTDLAHAPDDKRVDTNNLIGLGRLRP